MKFRFAIAVLSAFMLSVSLLGCSNDQDPQSSTQEQTSSEQAASEQKPIDLANTYTTRFEQANHVTFPVFCFNYPEGWNAIEDEMSPTTEVVTLTNERGTVVEYSMLPAGGAGYNLKMHTFTSDIAPVDVSSFVPKGVQAEDLSSLGTFSVMSATYPTDNGTGTLYCVLPDSYAGTNVDVAGPLEKAFSFPYIMDIAFVAYSVDGTFTDEETQEVIAILSSFRNNDDPIVKE